MTEAAPTASTAPTATGAAPGEPLHVVATAGHVDHGKSALIRRLTGIEPDRLAEEQRRGLTIDLGYAWCSLPSGREIGFVDVPGHERFVKNMLAGVGPVRLILFVVAADEGWKPQSEEHLQIVDVLGAAAGVVALTKADLVDASTLDLRAGEIEERLAGTSLEGSPVVPVSSATGQGVDRIAAELDGMIERAPAPETAARPRLFVDRVFTIRGAGTVVTGTLTGGPLRLEQQVELYPSGRRARVRGLQRHERPLTEARPVARVAVNLAGLDRSDVARGDVLGPPGQWRATGVFEGTLRLVRGSERALTARGAFKLYAGVAERDARLRMYGTSALQPGREAFVRLTTDSPVVLDVGEAFVLREAGRRETVAGGRVLDPDPPRRAGEPAAAASRLTVRRDAPRDQLPAILVRERGAIRASEISPATGVDAVRIEGARRLGAWWVGEDAFGAAREALLFALTAHHREHPLSPGLPADALRRSVAEAEPGLSPALERALFTELSEALSEEGALVGEGATFRLATHAVTLGPREDEARAVERALLTEWPAPPTVKELGADRELLSAMERTGRLVQVSADVILLPQQLAEAEAAVRELAAAPEGMTASAFRERLGTSRKYAIPLLEYFDEHGLTRRSGDVRHLRN